MGLGLGLGNTTISIGRNRLGSLRPYMDNLVFEGNTIVGGLYLDKDRVRANDAQLLSTCIYLNGVDAKAEITYTGNILYYLDRLTIIYSVDGINQLLWETGDANVVGLFQIDFDNNKLVFGFDGTNYKEMYLTSVICQYNNQIEYLTWNDYTLSLSNNSIDYDRAGIDLEYTDKLFPDFAEIRNLEIKNLMI
jgi:hypothetical protein